MCGSSASLDDVFFVGNDIILASCRSSALGAISLLGFQVPLAEPLPIAVNIASYSCSNITTCRILVLKMIGDDVIYITVERDVEIAVSAAHFVPPTAATIPRRIVTLPWSDSASNFDANGYPGTSNSNNFSSSFAYFATSDFLVLTDGTQFAQIPIETMHVQDTPMTITQTSDKFLRGVFRHSYWSRGREFVHSYFTDGFCWDDSHCPSNANCVRPDCVIRQTNCTLPPPASNAVCTVAGWVISGDVILGPSAPTALGTPTAPVNGSGTVVVVVTAPTTVVGNLVITGNVSSTPVIIQLKPAAFLNVTGCVTLSGNLSIEVSSTTPSGTEISALSFQGGYCGNQTTRFDGVTVVRTGAPECEQATATPEYRPTSLAIVMSFSTAACVATTNPDGSPSFGSNYIIADGFQIWMIGPIIGGVVLIVGATILLVFLLRKKIIPAYRATMQMRKLRNQHL